MKISDITSNWLNQQYTTLKKSLTEISKEFKLNRAELNKLLYKFNIQSRKKGQVVDRINSDGNILCTQCKTYQDPSNFHIRPNTKKYSSWCKKCHHSVTRKNFLQDKQFAQWRASTKRKTTHAERRKDIQNYKTKKGCCVCGYKEYPEAIDFHHLDPTTKESNITSLFYYKDYKDKVNKEVKKCILLCAICHRLVEHKHIDVSNFKPISEDVISS